jgi:hypothetical protein
MFGIGLRVCTHAPCPTSLFETLANGGTGIKNQIIDFFICLAVCHTVIPTTGACKKKEGTDGKQSERTVLASRTAVKPASIGAAKVAPLDTVPSAGHLEGFEALHPDAGEHLESISARSNTSDDDSGDDREDPGGSQLEYQVRPTQASNKSRK